MLHVSDKVDKQNCLQTSYMIHIMARTIVVHIHVHVVSLMLKQSYTHIAYMCTCTVSVRGKLST